MFINLSTRDKYLTLAAGLRYERLANKPAFLMTSLRHMAAYWLGLCTSPREMTVTLKGHVFRFKEFTGEIGMFPQIFLDLVYERLPGFGHLSTAPGTVLGTIRTELIEGAAKVRLITLDSFIEAEGIDSIDILKLDVEGYELKALNGLKRNLSRINRIVMECAAEHNGPVGRLLKKAGFDNPLDLPKFSVRYFTRL